MAKRDLYKVSEWGPDHQTLESATKQAKQDHSDCPQFIYKLVRVVQEADVPLVVEDIE